MIYHALLFLFLLALPLNLAAQRKTPAKTAGITSQEALMSSDVTVIAAYIRANPQDPELPALRSRILELMRPSRDAAAKAAVKPLTPAAIIKQTEFPKTAVAEKEPVRPAGILSASIVAKSSSASAPVTPAKISPEQAAKMVNHILNGSKNGREALIQITNSSACDLLVRISGKQFYNLTVPAQGRNYIMVEKGIYDLTTSVCDARYSSKKNVTQDLMITLSR